MKQITHFFFRRFPGLAGCLLLLGCVSGLSAQVNAVATTTMVADLVSRVGGDRVTVTGLMGPGVDPHLFKASARDVARLRRADVVFYNGFKLEGRMEDIFEQMARRGQPVYPVVRDLPKEQLMASEDYEGVSDPHVWFDPELWAACVPVVVEGLSGVDPEGAAYYEERGRTVAADILAVGEWARQRLQQVPAEHRVLVTSHDAFNYFGQAFGFEVVAVQGISTLNEAGLADIAEMADFIRERGIPAIFVESSVSPAAIERISTDSGATIGGELFSDAMGRAGDLETGPDGLTYDKGTWRGMVMHNVNTIAGALK
ncbi:MAG: metal ABC transporter solute-binding protein, Zn/Mn family [Opitutales bacterium]